MEGQHHTIERITTAGILFESGRYFIAKRKPGGAVGGLWEFPGGKHRWGETPQQSLAREFKEEFDIQVKVGSCLMEHDFFHKQTLFHLQAYWVQIEGPGHVKLHEHDEVRWVSVEEMIELPFVPSDIAIRDKLEELSLA